MVATVPSDVTFWTTGNIIWVSALSFIILSCCGFCCYIFAPGSYKNKNESESLLPKECPPG